MNISDPYIAGPNL